MWNGNWGSVGIDRVRTEITAVVKEAGDIGRTREPFAIQLPGIGRDGLTFENQAGFIFTRESSEYTRFELPAKSSLETSTPR